MDHVHPELAAEQAVIDRAYRRLDALREQARKASDEALDGAGGGGTHQARFEREAMFHTTARRLAELADAGSGLCFGRIDRRANADNEGDRLYIGRTAIADEANEPLLVDWRAPAAEPFYRATAREPMGLSRRRHFLLRGRRLVGIEDDLLALNRTPGAGGANGEGAGDGAGGDGDADAPVLIGEAALLATLEMSRTGRMADIVATIQREQDEIIRSPLAGILVVQGGPGTGKTAVALHRAAYLLYTHRFPLERGGVLLIGPNRVFLRYIERVLPSLGEQTVVFATPSGLVPAVAVAGVDPPDVARLKGASRMADVIARGVEQRQRALPRPVSVLVGRYRLTLTPGASAQIVDRARHTRGLHNQRRATVERMVMSHLGRQWRAQEGEDSTDEEWRQHARRIRREPVLVEALERMWPVLTPEAFLNDFFGVLALTRAASAGILDEAEAGSLHRPRARALADVAWTESDVALLDEAAALLGPLPRKARPVDRETDGDRWLAERAVEDAGDIDDRMRADLVAHLARWAKPSESEGYQPPDLATRTFSHLIVDEAQDLSPMQLRTLARRCPSGSMTIVGDLGQASGPAAPGSWAEVVGHLQRGSGRTAAPHRRPPTMAELTVNYRTPEEVMRLARRVLGTAAPELVPPTSARSSGVEPGFTGVAPGGDLVTTAAAVAGRVLAGIGDGRVGVIAPEALVAPLGRALGCPTGVDALDEQLAVLPLELAKGLEFDAVVVVEPAALIDERPSGLRRLYVALTRTTRILEIVHERTLPAPLT